MKNLAIAIKSAIINLEVMFVTVRKVLLKISRQEHVLVSNCKNIVFVLFFFSSLV